MILTLYNSIADKNRIDKYYGYVNECKRIAKREL